MLYKFEFELEAIDVGNILYVLRDNGMKFLASKLQKQYDIQLEKSQLEDVQASLQTNYEYLCDIGDREVLYKDSIDDSVRNHVLGAKYHLYTTMHEVDKAVKIYNDIFGLTDEKEEQS